MLFRDIDLVNINPLPEPPLITPNLNIVPTHLSFSHPSVFRKCPIFETIASPPLTRFIMEFIPELHCDLMGPVSISIFFEVSKHALLSRNANSSFLNLYPFSFAHFLLRNSTISSWPLMKVSRFLQMESSVYAFFTT